MCGYSRYNLLMRHLMILQTTLTNLSLVFSCTVVQTFILILAMYVENAVNCTCERRPMWDLCIKLHTPQHSHFNNLWAEVGSGQNVAVK